MMPIRVLVSGAGGDVAQGVLKALQASPLALQLHTTCINEHSAWLHVGIPSFIAPLSSADDYLDFLIRLMRKLGIQVYFPTVDSEILKISAGKSRIEQETGALVFVDDLEKVAVCNDKFATAEFLRQGGFAYPKTIAVEHASMAQMASGLGIPLIFKPRSGKGSQEVHHIDDIETLERLGERQGYIGQEWLDPAQGEFTTGVYLGDDGEIKGICTFRRQLRHGSTFIAERIIDKQLEQPLEDMARAIGMKYLNIQSMRRGHELVPFEFNGRLSGSTAMVTRIFNAPEMFIRERLLNERIDRAFNPELFVAMRYYEEVYATPEQIAALKSRSNGL